MPFWRFHWFFPAMQIKKCWPGLEPSSVFIQSQRTMICDFRAQGCWHPNLFLFPPQLPCLSSYDSYCSNQVAAKALLDHKKQDHRVQDFLQRCLESPFSRKLDLWNFLDIPRSRLVKYPLLLREILRHTPNDNPDQQHLEEAVSVTVYFSLPFSSPIMARGLGPCAHKTQKSWVLGLVFILPVTFPLSEQFPVL